MYFNLLTQDHHILLVACKLYGSLFGPVRRKYVALLEKQNLKKNNTFCVVEKKKFCVVEFVFICVVGKKGFVRR